MTGKKDRMRDDHRPLRILLVEDNIQDIEIARRALERGKIRNELHVMRDGEEALDYLYHRGKFNELSSSPRPEMIFLDLNLPKVGGMDILRQVKQDPDLKSIPVIVLTVSSREEEIAQCYSLGVNTYIQKPVEFESFVKIINTIHEYWMTASLPPPPSRP